MASRNGRVSHRSPTLTLTLTVSRFATSTSLNDAGWRASELTGDGGAKEVSSEPAAVAAAGEARESDDQSDDDDDDDDGVYQAPCGLPAGMTDAEHCESTCEGHVQYWRRYSDSACGARWGTGGHAASVATHDRSRGRARRETPRWLQALVLAGVAVVAAVRRD
jgi:hypothetical protein